MWQIRKSCKGGGSGKSDSSHIVAIRENLPFPSTQLTQGPLSPLSLCNSTKSERNQNGKKTFSWVQHIFAIVCLYPSRTSLNMICAVRTPGRKADTSHPDVDYTLHFQEIENREGLVQEVGSDAPCVFIQHKDLGKKCKQVEVPVFPQSHAVMVAQ